MRTSDRIRSRRFLHCFSALLAFAGLAAAAEIVLQRGHDLEVLAAVYSPDGRVMASSGEAEAIRLWDRESGDLIGTLPGHAERVVGLAFSPDGKWLASCSTDGTVKVWDYRAGKLVHAFNEHAGDWTRRVAFSPDSRLLTAATYDGQVSVWDVAGGAVVRTLPVGGRVADVLFTPDGRSVVTASRENDRPFVQFWDAASGAPGLKLDHGGPLAGIAISRDGRLLGSGGPGHVNLWELPSGRLRRRIETEEKEGMLGLDLSPDGRWLATDGLSASRVRSTDSGAVVGELRGHQDGTYQVHFSPDGSEIATASADASFRLWKVRDGSLKRIFSRRPLNAPVSSLAFSPDGSAEALGSANGMVHVWNARDGSFKSVFHQHEGPVLALTFSVDGAWLFSGSADRTMRLWDMSLGTIAGTLPLFDRVDAIGTLAVGGTQNLIASASGPLASTSLDHSIKLWPTHGDRPSLVLDGHAGNVVSVAFAQGADLLASTSTDRTMKLWDSRNGKCLLTLPLDVPVEVLAFPPDARWLAAGLADGRVRVLDPKTLATLREWRAHQRPVQSLAVSRDGRWIATASGDGNAVVWDSATGGEVRRFTNITSQYLPLAFHPQQPVLAFAPRDEMVVHANVETGEILFQRVLFADGEWLAWNPAKMFYLASPRGDEHARVRFGEQLIPVYPLELYRKELHRDTIAAFAGPAPVLAPKDFALWWHRYPYKRAWFYGGLSVLLVWMAGRLRKGWIAERRRRAQEAFTRRLLQSQEEERQRIAGELHDSLGQNLQIIKNRAVMGLNQGSVPPGLAEQLREISGGAARAIAEVRAITHALRPAELDRDGLTRAIGWLGEAMAESSGLSIEQDLEKVDGWLSPEDEVNLYRIVQEALNNAVKHAAATRLTLELKRTASTLQLSVFDNGKGFDPAARPAVPSRSGGGHGLIGMEERARLLGGRAEIQSAPGKGTRLTVTIKLGKPFAPDTAAKSNS